jgi:hypothetical protein
MKSNELCNYPECRRRAVHPHHVTYDTDKTDPLCLPHHMEITKINIDHSGQGYKLFDKERKTLDRQWRRGEVKPQGNPDSEPWIADWSRRKR